MAIDFTKPALTELRPKITVIGVGGAGGNAVNNMITAGLKGVDFVAANTDAQALANSRAETKIQLGVAQTKGLGAGARPEIGRSAAEETLAQIEQMIEGSNMVFITAGMGGGTGTGAAPVIARAARERGILTVGVVTKPFLFEGRRRMRMADGGIEELQKNVDTLIIIPNQNLFRLANEKTSFIEAFAMADQVLHSGVRGITDLMLAEGLINLDFADICTVMSEMGKAMMGTGEAEGEHRAIDAAEAAISNPLLDEVSLKGARGVIVNVTGGHDLSLMEIDEAINHIAEQVDPDANIIFGAAFDESLAGKFRLTVVATGIEAGEMREPLPRETNIAAHSAQGLRVVTPIRSEAPAPEPVVETAALGVLDLKSEGEAIAEVKRPEKPVLREPILPGRATARIAPEKPVAATPSLLERMRFGGRRAEETEAEPATPQMRIDPADRPAPTGDGDHDLKIPPFLYKISN